MKLFIIALFSLFITKNLFADWSVSITENCAIYTNSNSDGKIKKVRLYKSGRILSISITLKGYTEYENLLESLLQIRLDSIDAQLFPNHRTNFINFRINRPSRYRQHEGFGTFFQTLNRFEAIEPENIYRNMEIVADLLIMNRQLDQTEIARQALHPPFSFLSLLLDPPTLPTPFWDTDLATPSHPRDESRKLETSQYRVLKNLGPDDSESCCPICQEELAQKLNQNLPEEAEETTEVVEINCDRGHKFCKSCIEEAYRYQQICPLCRGSIKKK
jgi:hypothetical protein